MSFEHDQGAEQSAPFGVGDPLVGPRNEDSDSAASRPAETDAQPEQSSSSSLPAAPARSSDSASAQTSTTFEERPRRAAESPNMLPTRERGRSGLERLIVRLIATCGIVAIGVAIAAIMVSSKSQGWIVGLVVSIVTVILAAVLWSSRML